MMDCSSQGVVCHWVPLKVLGQWAPDDDEQPPKIPFRNQSFEGPWLEQQLALTLFIGITSFLAFCFMRRRFTALFAPRTKLHDFAPPTKNLDDSSFSWIMPTLRMSESKVLHIVGLDAAVLLSFFKMSFWLFFFLSIWCTVVLMPVNWSQYHTIDGVPKGTGTNGTDVDGVFFATDEQYPLPPLPETPHPTFFFISHLASTYLFTFITLRALWKNYTKFVRSRQLYALELLETIPARTVEVRNLPIHLRDDRALAEYFEGMGMAVESTAVVRETSGLATLLKARADALYDLENTWAKWLGNPTPASNYDSEAIAAAIRERAQLLDVNDDTVPREETDLESAPLISNDRLDDPAPLSGRDPIEDLKVSRPRPTMRVSAYNPFAARVDALDEMERRFRKLDRAVMKVRMVGHDGEDETGISFKFTAVGFVTFVNAESAQIAAQIVHYPLPTFCSTTMAPEPRDIVWSNISLPAGERRARQLLVSVALFVIYVSYLPPLAALASLLSPQAIERYAPWLLKLLDRDERLKALVTNSLPYFISGFNAIMPIFLEWSGYAQGLKARSLIEYSVLKKYFLFLLVSVIFIVLITRTAWGVLEDLADNPMSIVDKLASSLPGARHFSLSYVVLQALAIQPLQLLQVPVILSRFFQSFFTRTPREHAQLNSPPQLYMGTVYPQALIVFTLCILYSVVSPLICIFGTIYFGVGYLVNKYKLLYVYYKSYESRGQAWTLSASRCIWALVFFQIFQLSLFSVRKQVLLSSLTLPLILFTMWFGHHMHTQFDGLSRHVNLSSISEIRRAEREGDSPAPVTPGDHDPVHMRNTAVDEHLSHLARKRYAARDEALFVAQRDKHTDYREPPANDYYPGVLNTGRRRYGHPAITGILPDVWLPIAAAGDDAQPAPAQDASNGSAVSTSTTQQQAIIPSSSKATEPVIVSLRRRKSSLLSHPSVRSALGRRGRTISTSSAAPSATAGDASTAAAPSTAESNAAVTTSGEADTGSGPVLQPATATAVRGSTGASGQGSSSPSASKRASTLLGEVLTEEFEGVVPDGEEQAGEDLYGDEDEGVYIHRTVRSGTFPGAFPGAVRHDA